MEKANADRRRICQEQSLRTVYDQMDTLCPPSLSPHVLFFIPPLLLFFSYLRIPPPSVVPRPRHRAAATPRARERRESLLLTEEEEEAETGGGLARLFSRLTQSSPAMSEQMVMQSTSGHRE